MGKKGGSAPSAPDPKKTAEAQTGTNVSTAIANAQLGNVNQVTPYGNLTYSEIGNYQWTDPSTGATYTVPKFQATQTLSPGEQNILDKTQAAENNLAELAKNQSGFLNEYLQQPVKLGNEEVEKRLFELGSARLTPQLERDRELLESRLANRGLRLGSDAYRDEMKRFDERTNDAYNSLLLSGRGQAVQEQLAERNQPINEISALLSQSQVSQPNFVNTQQNTIPTTDYAGIVDAKYRNDLAVWQQQQAQKQATLGGLFSLGSSLISLSDRRAKTDIRKVGKAGDLPVYTFRYKGDPRTQMGLMAQDVEKKRPDAVTTLPGGLKGVDYGKAFRLGA